MRRVSIHIGEMYASREATMVETVLGSCVAACLYDPVHRVGGMNHILLPRRYHGDPTLARYGEHAMPMLIQRIVRLGGEKKHLQAKVFGGASVLTLDESAINVPKANQSFVREFLIANGIPVVSERLGGRQPLTVRMFTATGKALVRALPRTQLDPVLTQEGEQYMQALARRWEWFPEGATILHG